MKYFIIEGVNRGSITKSEAEIGETLEKHRHYVNSGIEDGTILFGGPKSAGDGGIIIIKAKTTEDAKTIMNNDPLATDGLHEPRLIEFDLYKSQKFAAEWFD
ncbi:MAG: YciI family protein [Synergistaceae bacterium]|jgi:uncharacterized protein YciI|nr:YciI family protein [Synergistaceae bacterium]